VNKRRGETFFGAARKEGWTETRQLMRAVREERGAVALLGGGGKAVLHGPEDPRRQFAGRCRKGEDDCRGDFDRRARKRRKRGRKCRCLVPLAGEGGRAGGIGLGTQEEERSHASYLTCRKRGGKSVCVISGGPQQQHSGLMEEGGKKKMLFLRVYPGLNARFLSFFSRHGIFERRNTTPPPAGEWPARK